MASDEDRVSTPDWILRLENKHRRTHKLAHDIGAGAPCLQCNSCPGLDLHFWRKLCKKCKCKKEEHDVKDEDGCEQFEILLGVGHKKQTPKRAFLNIRVEGCGIEVAAGDLKTENPSDNKDASVSFDWVPPDITSALAEEYMLQLPVTKLPISGSDGAQYRRMQLEKQVPIHDLDASKCHGLSTAEIDLMQAYVNEIKSNVVGQGRVTKLMDPVKYTEQRVKHTMPHAGVVSGEPVKAQSIRHNAGRVVKQPTGHNGLNNALADGSILQTLTPPPSPSHTTSGRRVPISSASVASPLPYHPNHPSPPDDTPESPPPPLPTNPPPLFDPNAPNNFGLHPDEQKHFPTPGSFIPAYLGGYSSNQAPAMAGASIGPQASHQLGMQGQLQDRHHVGEGSPEDEMEWPAPPSSEEMAESGSGLNQMQLAKGRAMSGIADDLPSVMGGLTMADDGFPLEGTVDTMAPKWHCHKCNEQVKGGEVVVVAERAGANVCWHPRCFVCNICKELLVDLIYFFRKGEVYCGRHFAEIMDIPRCNACDELIFVPNYTSAEGRSYHVKHFCCFECDIPLGGMKYILVDDQPNCLNCYQAKYGKTCHACKQSIAAGDQRVSLKELNWHVTATCFCCASCKKFLLGGKFTVKETQPFCSRTCVETYFCPQTAL